MARQEINSAGIKTEQLPPMVDDGDDNDRDPEVILVDERLAKKEYLADLAFYEEPVTIRIQPGTEENAAQHVPAWVNGRGAERLVKGKWITYGYLPVGEEVTTKRKYVEVLLRSKRNTIKTEVKRFLDSETNETTRPTSSTVSLSILEDRNPKGAAWATELMRRNY